jgi:hypothetical protein
VSVMSKAGRLKLTSSRYGHGESGSVETHQYSVTSHKRSLTGGTAQDEGHKERLHARGGIPGVFFSFGTCTADFEHSKLTVFKTSHR